MSDGWKPNDNTPHWERRLEKVHAKIVEALHDNPSWSYSEALSFVQKQFPEMFHAKDDGSDKAAASRTRAQAIDRVVRAVQAGTELSYDEAWQIAKAKHAQLFSES